MPDPASTDSHKHSRAEESVYFCENSSLLSFSAIVDDRLTITEQEISEFIRYSKPDLYEKLNGIRIASSHLASDGVGCAKSPSVDGADDINTAESDRSYHSLQHGGSRLESFVVEDSPPFSTNETGFLPCSPAGQDQRLGDLEPLVLAGRYVFTLHQHAEPDMVYCCSHPTCEYPRHVIPCGEFFGMMQDRGWNEGNQFLTEYQRTVYFCFECLQQVLEQEFGLEEEQHMLPPFLDGCDREDVLEAAENIHPRLTQKELFFVYLPEGPTLDPGVGSNSVKGKRLRRQKQFEIEWILARARENERARRMRKRNKISNGPSDLQIRPLVDCEPARERYKKQGLERSDVCEETQVHCTPTVNTGIPTHDTEHCAGEMKDLFCFCREPCDDQGEMVHCSSEACMFGWIHFQCSGLSQMPSSSQDYLCKYCREGDAMLLETNSTPARSDEGSSDKSPTGPRMTENVLEPEQKTYESDSDEEQEVIHRWTAFVAVNQMRSASICLTDFTDPSASDGGASE